MFEHEVIRAQLRVLANVVEEEVNCRKRHPLRRELAVRPGERDLHLSADLRRQLLPQKRAETLVEVLDHGNTTFLKLMWTACWPCTCSIWMDLIGNLPSCANSERVVSVFASLLRSWLCTSIAVPARCG